MTRRVIGMKKVSILGHDGQVLTLTITAYSYPDADNYWDSNWLVCMLDGCLPGFTFKYRIHIRTVELQRFQAGLLKMYESLIGSAEFITMDRGLEMKVTIDHLGKLEWNGSTCYPSSTGTTLEFSFESDQSYLDKLILELEEALKEYPVIGKA